MTADPGPAVILPSATRPAAPSWRRALSRGGVPSHRLREPALLGAAAAGGSTIVGLVDPGEPGHYPLCPIRALTGFYCPGCGGLRAVHALLHGDVTAALWFNPLVVAALPVCVAAYLWWVRRRWRGGHSAGAPRTGPGPAAYWLTGAVFALMLTFGVLRNLPAFAVLAP